MSFKGAYACGRCKKEITGNSVIVNFKNQSHFREGLDLCSDCFSEFLDWVKNPEMTKLGPVERVARRESSESIKLGPVERVAKREDNK